MVASGRRRGVVNDMFWALSRMKKNMTWNITDSNTERYDSLIFADIFRIKCNKNKYKKISEYKCNLSEGFQIMNLFN